MRPWPESEAVLEVERHIKGAVDVQLYLGAIGQRQAPAPAGNSSDS
ncbi:hypothetical protein PZ739_17150 [Pseudomonas kermanshahensis]|nr:hypothetical protein [Pseudomonas kermanshahensis]WEL53565.1 hypothetical protein PZ739_17150 [Pseudomonas kermanshahensis]